MKHVLFICGLYMFGLLFSSLLQAEDAASSKGVDIYLLDCNLTLSENSDFAINARLNKSVYRIGDELMLDITPERDAYISVIDQGSEPENPERGHVLFENVFVNKEATYTFPPPDLGKLQVSEPTGKNTFEIIASITPLPNEEAEDEGVNGKNVDLVPLDTRKQTAMSRCLITFEITD